MVQSRAQTVDLYLAEAAPERAALLTEVRGLARRVLSDHEERMHWGMPAYLRDGRISFGFAAQSRYTSLYFVDPSALEKNAEAIAGFRRGKNCIRLRDSEAVDWAVLERLLVDTRKGEPQPLNPPSSR